MKLLEYLKEFPRLFDWYFQLAQLKRIQLNYIVLIALIIFFAYKNDSRHRENYTALSVRFDAANAGKERDKEKYTKSLEFYTDKFNHLLEMLIQQEKEIKEIKKEA